MYTNYLGKNLALNLFFYSANSLMENTVDSSSFATITFVGHPFSNSAHCDVYNITFIVDSHVCGQRSNTIFCKKPREHTMGASPLSLCVSHRHFGKLTGWWQFQPKGWLSFISLSCLITLPRTSSPMLNWSDKSRHSCLNTIRGKYSTFYH